MNSKLATVFNKQLNVFINQSPKVYPGVHADPDAQQLISKIRIVTEISPEVPIIQFKRVVVDKYSELIKNSDDSFFDHLKTEHESLQFFKQIYQQSNDVNKEIIWKYLNQFSKLAAKYQN